VRVEADCDDERSRKVEELSAEAQSSLDLEDGPLQRFLYLDCGLEQGEPFGDRLLLVFHHLVVDGVSWRILLEDLHSIYRQLQAGQQPVLPPKTTSYKGWSEVLVAEAEAIRGTEEEKFWRRLEDWEGGELPVDDASAPNLEGSAQDCQVALSREETEDLLTRAHAVYRTDINDILLTALARAYRRWTGSQQLLVDLEGHGRDHLESVVDVSRTLGWFTTLYPVTLDLQGFDEAGATLKAVKEQVRSIPRRGLGFGLTYYSARQPCESSPPAPAPILFNYLGQTDRALSEDSPFTAAPENPGLQQSPDERRSHEIELNAVVSEGRLKTTWTYGGLRWRSESMERWANLYVEELRLLLAHCLSPEAGGYTPSDFARIDLAQDELDDLLADLQQSMAGES
jgi:non-ribosomal peptide synthase protein (TIGR01720 family)